MRLNIGWERGGASTLHCRAGKSELSTSFMAQTAWLRTTPTAWLQGRCMSILYIPWLTVMFHSLCHRWQLPEYNCTTVAPCTIQLLFQSVVACLGPLIPFAQDTLQTTAFPLTSMRNCSKWADRRVPKLGNNRRVQLDHSTKNANASRGCFTTVRVYCRGFQRHAHPSSRL